MNIQNVTVKRMATTNGEYDAIRIFVADMWFTREIDTDRDIRLAKRLADETGARFSTDDALARRVDNALNRRNAA